MNMEIFAVVLFSITDKIIKHFAEYELTISR
jgi:hypothetical protein